ncbi:Flagellar hook-associated protein 1 [Posidoniimonas polymericola]|uniref:Flagellar hook-associated protein 1 n=1 Tax=Posidoniimonas polymericola TaxID=2528002 RepID=A0A5C5YCW1_9BACT|nr:flagellar hook-associated protein FlgK [Posidoniimonas polymericola]TWT73536.1 Flagellar hook-associated protein 1 [Posidoniimonas polymericola]
MSLFGSLQIASNALQATQIGLHVVGNNIANANTPGFIREEVVYSPAPVQKFGRLTLGLGVEIDAIVQKVDRFLSERTRNAASDRAGAEVQSKAYADLESLLNELTDTDLSTGLTGFFNSIDGIADAPADISARNLVIGKGKTLASDLRRLSTRAVDVRNELDTRLGNAAEEINQLSERIRVLNLRIATSEGGSASASEAGGLRSERNAAVSRLAELVDITSAEQPNGSLNVSVGGDFLVFDALRRDVKAVTESGDGLNTTTIKFEDNNKTLNLSGGEVFGLTTARDEIVGSFVDSVDAFAATLINEFNKVYSQGQGAIGFDTLTSVNGVSDPDAVLDEAGLDFTPVNGSFQLLVYTEGADGTVSTDVTDINVDLNGIDGDSSLTTLAAQLDRISGIRASVDNVGRLSLAADARDTTFAFADDSSGVLAALGLNTFFTGSDARSINVNQELDGVANAAKFAAARDGETEGNDNALQLSAFFDRELDVLGGASLADQYDELINEVVTGATIASSVSDGLKVFEATLQGEEQAISGVNIDEEAINMIQLQRTYQANARLVQTISEMLDILVNI